MKLTDQGIRGLPLSESGQREYPDEAVRGLDPRFEYFRYKPHRRIDHRAIAAERVRRFDAGLPAAEVFAMG